MKKKMVLIGILILLSLLGMYAKREKSLGEVLDIAKENIWQCTVGKAYNEGTQWEYESAVIEDTEEVETIYNLLDETTVSFKTWKWNSDLEKDEHFYELMVFDDSKHWIRFMENGEIQILNGGHWVFDVSESDLFKNIGLLKEYIDKHE